jgi:hypothetical protein
MGKSQECGPTKRAGVSSNMVQAANIKHGVFGPRENIDLTNKHNLVGGLEHDLYFSIFSHHIGNVMIPTDEVHHFSEG